MFYVISISHRSFLLPFIKFRLPIQSNTFNTFHAMSRSIARYCQFHIYFLFRLFANGHYFVCFTVTKKNPHMTGCWRERVKNTNDFMRWIDFRCVWKWEMLRLFFTNHLQFKHVSECIFFLEYNQRMRWKSTANGRPFPVCQNQKRFTQLFFFKSITEMNGSQSINKWKFHGFYGDDASCLMDDMFVCAFGFFFCVMLVGTLHC